MKLSAEILDLRAANDVFRIARGAVTAFRVVIVRIEHEGAVGLGEASPSEYYHETPETVFETVRQAGAILGPDPFLLEDVTARLAARFPAAPSARAAIDMALHDLAGKLLGSPLYRLLGLNPDRTPATSFTISIDEPEVMAERAAAAASRFKVLKIKVGTDRDLERIRAIRRVTDLPLRVDANTGWTPEQAVDCIRRLAEFNVEFVEQPIPPGNPAALRYVHERAPLPIMTDESSLTLADLPALVGSVDAINIKLMKCGGIREAIRMIHFAHAHGLKVMLGCMLESSLAVTAAAHLSPLVEYADLDGNLLIAADPFAGVTVAEGRLVLPTAPGLGVRRRASA